jgi:hypothetical protein
MCLGAPFQEIALGKKSGLVHLSCEDMVFGQATYMVDCPVPAGLLAAWNAARQAANALTTAQEASSGRHMLDLLSSREKMLLQIDRSFKVELCFLGNLAEKGGAQS